jgi:ribonuclease HI
MKYTLYTDGSCSGNPGPGGWGVVLISDSGTRELSGFHPFTTNQRMEICAAIEGLKRTEPGSVSVVYSDSMYVVNTMRLKYGRWANLDLWEALDALVKERTVAWLWVRGHSGNEFNEWADQLARDAVQQELAGWPALVEFRISGPLRSKSKPRSRRPRRGIRGQA